MALGTISTAFAQDTLESRLDRAEKQFEENRKFAEDLQKQNETLLKLLNGGAGASSPTAAPGNTPLATEDVRSIVNGYLQEKEVKQKAAAGTGNTDADSPYKIGSDLRLSASWKNGVFLNTPNNDFTMHIGGWMQYDNVFWDQTAALKTAPGKAGPSKGIGSGAAPGGIGDLEDGTYFRRIRFQTNGTFWENYEYNLTIALENIQYSSIGLDEFWIGATNIPVIGTARIGHIKNAVGLEGNWTASSKAMTFLEQSSYAEAINLNQYDVDGLWLGNNYLDQRFTWSSTLFRPDFNSTTSAFFGDGQWGAHGRLTGLPLYQDDGRHLLHLGLSGGWVTGTNNVDSTTPNSNLRSFDLRARAQLRDDDPAGSPSGGQVLPNANSVRMIDTGTIIAANDFMLGTEFLYILGPFSVQAEYGWNFLDDATGFVSSTGALTKLKNPQGYVFNGGYLQFAYTLTGENRSYDKRLGRLDSFYFGRKAPYSNAWLVRDEDGHLNWSLGAWELAVRLGHVDLNDGVGLERIQGGVMDDVTVGLNWYLNNNLSFKFDYSYDHRYDLPAATIPGSVRGLGMRMQFIY